MPLWLGRRSAGLVRVLRYSATSLVAFGVSEIVLVALYGTHLLGATAAAFVANVAGTIPSYLMSRYWIWSESSRKRVGRQVVLYWATSAVCIVLTSLATGAIAHLVPAGHRFHVAVVAVGFLVVQAVFWVAKYLIYEHLIFTGPERGGGTAPVESVR